MEVKKKEKWKKREKKSERVTHAKSTAQIDGLIIKLSRLSFCDKIKDCKTF